MPSFEDRKAIWARKRSELPFEVVTPGTKRPHTAAIANRKKYGLFERIPFPERITQSSPEGETVWLFTSREESMMFQSDYGGRLIVGDKII